jgi:hypothetical protein
METFKITHKSHLIRNPKTKIVILDNERRGYHQGFKSKKI